MNTFTRSSIGPKVFSPVGAAGFPSPNGVIAVEVHFVLRPKALWIAAATSGLDPKCCKEAPRPSNVSAVQTLPCRIPAAFVLHVGNHEA